MQLQISKKDVKVVDGFYPSRYTKEEYRHGIMSLQDKMMSMPDAILEDSKEYPLRHTFADKQYIREVQFPKGHLIVTKIHNVQHPFFLMSGEISFLTEKGETRISAPYYGITDVVFGELYDKDHSSLEISKELNINIHNILKFS